MSGDSERVSVLRVSTHADAVLSPLSPAELAEWYKTLFDEYEESLRLSGESAQSARENVERNRRELFDGDEPREGQHFLGLRIGDEVVGRLWIGTTSTNPELAYIYYVLVPESARGKGWGREIMVRAEEWARARGARRLALNVFGYNTVARGLYQSLGYEESAIRMLKELG